MELPDKLAHFAEKLHVFDFRNGKGKKTTLRNNNKKNIFFYFGPKIPVKIKIYINLIVGCLNSANLFSNNRNNGGNKVPYIKNICINTYLSKYRNLSLNDHLRSCLVFWNMCVLFITVSKKLITCLICHNSIYWWYNLKLI